MTRNAVVILILLMAVIAMHDALGFACVTYQDCPVQKCAGAVRQCVDSMCIYSNCIVPDESSIKPREDVESFDETVKPFEKGINLSTKTKNPAGAKNNIIGALGLQGVLAVLLRVIGIIFIALFVALFLMFLRGKGLARIILIFLIITLVVLSVAVILGGTGFLTRLVGREKSWNTIEPDDFLGSWSAKTELGSNQIGYVSGRLLNAADYLIEKNGREADVLILEIDDARYLSSLRLGNLLKGNLEKLGGEQIMEQGTGSLKTYLFDEDRFAFAVTADESDIGGIATDIIKRYPGAPTKSRLFISDTLPPVIYGLTPSMDSVTNDDVISFMMEDNGSGIDGMSLRVRGISGFDRTGDDCTESGMVYSCSFAASGLAQGDNSLAIEVSDMVGNRAEIMSRFVYDSKGIELAGLSPSQGSYSSSRRIVFRLVDTVSGIDPDSIYVTGVDFSPDSCNISQKVIECGFDDYGLAEGKNTISIAAADNAGNSDTIGSSFYYDATPPEIIMKDYYFEAFDNVGIAAVRVNGRDFNVQQCSGDNRHYYCSTTEKIESVSVQDFAGNTREERQ